MKILNLFFTIITSLVFVFPLMAKDGFPGLQVIMDENQLKQTGIHKLTPAELKALNDWLARYMTREKESVNTELKAVVEEEAAKNPSQREESKQQDRVVSRIDGKFNGWSDGTVFRLTNGQVWKQRYKSTLHYRAVDPEVEITRNVLGFYILRIVGTSLEVGVTRIK